MHSCFSFQLGCVAEVNDPIRNSRDATEWDLLAATGAFSGVKPTAAPQAVKEQMKRMKVVHGHSHDVVGS